MARTSTDQRAAEPTILIGRCTTCGQAFRAEVPADWPVPGPHPTAAWSKATGNPIFHNCTGERCSDEIRYRVLKATFKAEVACGPGNCWGAKSSTCTCSCYGRNHGRMHAIIGGTP